MGRLNKFFSKNWKIAARIRLDIFLKTQQVCSSLDIFKILQLAAHLTFLEICSSLDFAARLTLQLGYGFLIVIRDNHTVKLIKPI